VCNGNKKQVCPMCKGQNHNRLPVIDDGDHMVKKAITGGHLEWMQARETRRAARI
jgi:hypothetical protein